MPRTRRKKAAAGSDSRGSSGSSDLSGEMPREKAVNASKRWVPMVHPGEWAVVSSAGEEIAVAPSGEAGMVPPGEWAPVRAEEMAVLPVVHPGEWAPVSSAGEEIAVAPSGEAGVLHPGEWALVSGEEMAVPPVVHPGEWAPVSGEEMPFKKADASSSGGVLMVHPRSWVNFTALSGGSTEDCEESAEDCEESADKHHGKKARRVCVIQLPEEHCTEDKADMGLSGGLLQKQISKVKADMGLSGEMLHELPAREDDTSLSGEMLHEHPAEEADTSLSGEMLDQHDHPAEEADTSKDIKDSDPNEAVHVKKAELHIQEIHEAELFIKELNQSGVGEDISDEEFLAYFERLACKPPWIDLEEELTDEALDQQDVDHALCRFRYYKHKLSQQVSKEEHGDNLLEEGEDDKEEGEYDTTPKEKHLLYIEEDDTTSEDDDNLMDKTEADCNLEFLEKKHFFISFEKDGTLDWFFHRDYCKCASLNDYQRLVLKNYGGTEYSMWSEYHSYLRSYDIEREYVKYCGELSKQLKWMEDYVDICRSSVKWAEISCRGAYQAIKIAATNFPKITPTLAYTGYGEYKEDICYHHDWFKEYDDLYFEIWRQVTKGMSFREAVERVCKLNRFPVRQRLMQTALVNECTMKMMEKDFHTCTAAIHDGVKEDKAKELIAIAVKKLVNMPKSYKDYITRKIQIAHIIKILPSERTEATV